MYLMTLKNNNFNAYIPKWEQSTDFSFIISRYASRNVKHTVFFYVLRVQSAVLPSIPYIGCLWYVAGWSFDKFQFSQREGFTNIYFQINISYTYHLQPTGLSNMRKNKPWFKKLMFKPGHQYLSPASGSHSSTVETSEEGLSDWVPRLLPELHQLVVTRGPGGSMALSDEEGVSTNKRPFRPLKS